eukprot:7798217-Lingulodinium_polyedra.AAC.1
MGRGNVFALRTDTTRNLRCLPGPARHESARPTHHTAEDTRPYRRALRKTLATATPANIK